MIGEGPARPWFEERLPEAIFTGQLTGDDLARAVASADVLLNPSITEAFGNVTLEAMASGLPVVAAEATGGTNLCFRIQAQASLAAGRHIPMIVENVRGAQPWVGRARWNFGSYYLWGDVPALMPLPGFRLDGSGSFQLGRRQDRRRR